MRSAFLFVLIIIAFQTQSQKSQWYFELKGGFPLDVPMPLTIHQDGYPDININFARFTSEPFVMPVYWDWRFVKWKNEKAWEFEAIHHKMYLQNKPAEVQRFGISHGYNILLVNRIKILNKEKNILLKFGAGTVLAHAENTIRNLKLNERLGIFNMGYYFSGVALNIGIDKRFKLTEWLYATSEAKFIPSYANVPVVNGNADVWNCSFQFSFGLEVKL